MDLGDAMARAAGWEETTMATTTPKPLATITVNKYETPTASNAGCAYSVGIMNLTRDEANALSDYASVLQRDRSMSAAEQRERAIAEGRRNPTINGGDVRPFGGRLVDNIVQGRRVWGRPNLNGAEVYGSPAWEARTKQLRDEAFGALVDDEVDGRAAALREAYKAEQAMSPDDKRRYLTGVFDPPGFEESDQQLADRMGAANVARYKADRERDVLTKKQLQDAGLEWSPKAEPAKEPEPVRNRFSGLDIE